MTRALVIGGAGFIGVAACKELMRRGVETIAAGRTPQPYGVFTSFVQLDRTDPSQLATVLSQTRPDVILDMAAYRPADVAGVLERFDGTRYVFVSTGVYPDLHGRIAREEDFTPLGGEVPEGDLEYREGKRWCETVLWRHSGGPEWVILRPPAVLGPADPSLRIAAYIQRLEDGGPVLVPVETWRWRAALAWVRDAGYACALACDLRKPIAGMAFNVGFEAVSLAGLLENIAAALGVTPNLVPVPFDSIPAGARPYGPDPARHAGLSLERARDLLGFQPSALGDALAETLAWYRVRRPSHPGYAGRSAELGIAAAGS